GATNSINSLMIGLLMGLANGFAITTARRFGAGDHDGVRRSVGAIFTWSLIFSLSLSVLTVLGLHPLLRALNTSDELIGQSAAYFRIILLGAVVTMLYNMCASVLRASGDSVTPLIVLIFAALLNVGLDLLCVCVLKMGVQGAALATVTAQAVSVVLCLIYVRRRYAWLWPRAKELCPDAQTTGQLFGAGISMALTLSLVNIGSVLLQSAINTFGVSTIVAHTAARRLTELFMLPFSVLGQTMATYCGQNRGAGRFDRIRQGIWQSLVISWGWCVIVIVMSWTVVPSLVRAVTGTQTAEVIDTATLYLRVDTLFYAITVAISIIRNSLQGIGDHITPIVSSAIELGGKLAIVLFLTPRLGYFGVILAEPIVWALMVIPLIVMLLKNPVMQRRAPQKAVLEHV
ncbi:MAG: MATE family efflux transporter, partial [Butyricicoccus sp.]